MKDILISDLWRQAAVDAASSLYPRRKKNKQMKMLTLTDRDFKEIKEFERIRLTKRDLVVAWTYSYQNTWRLETALGKSEVLGSTRYENEIISNPQSILCHFPFDIINLDFYSQNPLQVNERIEKEIKSTEYTIKFQNEKSDKGTVLIYTTKIDSNPLNPNLMKEFSDSIIISEWHGLSINGFSYNITHCQKKIRFIEHILKEICTKYNYNNSFKKLFLNLPGDNEHIYSIAGLLERNI